MQPQSLHIATSETACPGGSGKESGIRIGSDNNERSRTLAAQLLPASQATYRPLPGTRGLQERLPQSIVCRSLLSARAEAEELKPAPPHAAPQGPPHDPHPPASSNGFKLITWGGKPSAAYDRGSVRHRSSPGHGPCLSLLSPRVAGEECSSMSYDDHPRNRCARRT
ncbi:hypothetical protein Purlil1_9267 [Purpureocillium lilacinum]|uniref:Uncharacterized protein n=1 Tax=Purpureocillium lilacinum TaxID=33203 RepID=A0ABR0BR54_PURLI|nr:hypothetical protein Purlil1_9267 [Purpureocillium lilacinum]